MKLDISDKEIILAIKEGDRDAYSKLYILYYDRLCKYVYSLSSDYKQAEDIVQDLLIGLWINRGKLNIKTSLNNYLYRAVHNKFINLYKKNVREQSFINSIHREAIIELECFERDIKEGRLIALERVIEQLPPKRKEVFILSKLNNYKYKEIAKMLKISESTVESQIRKAMITIRGEMHKLSPDFENIKNHIAIIFFILYTHRLDFIIS
ncbi:RNA polymerase sigma-70 factor [Seonamhaeicola sp.]|uniref:RNA polymerase sigma factor n=1 Tax=Seonamhaeicola sp. TaxID=1912245 RepID=UPI00262A600F|nr:RNA polymerase sigma-70 factor [Seonamhaeicola sp.]